MFGAEFEGVFNQIAERIANECPVYVDLQRLENPILLYLTLLLGQISR